VPSRRYRSAHLLQIVTGLHGGRQEALEDKAPPRGRIWKRIPDDVLERLIMLALDRPKLSPCEMTVTFTDRAPIEVVACILFACAGLRSFIHRRVIWTDLSGVAGLQDSGCRNRGQWPECPYGYDGNRYGRGDSCGCESNRYHLVLPRSRTPRRSRQAHLPVDVQGLCRGR
jgi:hypothetical protein